MKNKFAALIPFAPAIGYILLAVGAVVAIYYTIKQLESSIGAGTSSDSSVQGAQTNASLLDGAINSTVQLGHSSQSYTGAVQQVVTSPLTSIESILGFNQG